MLRKPWVFVVAAAACSAHAQMATYLYNQVMDPEIVRKAGSDAASGNLRMNNIDLDRPGMDSGSRGAVLAPSAEDIAREIRRQEAQERTDGDRRRLAAMQARVRSRIAQEYEHEFGKR